MTITENMAVLSDDMGKDFDFSPLFVFEGI